jgi:hypothetical protein
MKIQKIKNKKYSEKNFYFSLENDFGSKHEKLANMKLKKNEQLEIKFLLRIFFLLTTNRNDYINGFHLHKNKQNGASRHHH